VVFIDDEASNPYIVRSYPVTISDRKLTMNMGLFDEYTMLNYLDIEAILPSVQTAINLFLQGFYIGSGLMTTDLQSSGFIPTDSPFSEDPQHIDPIPTDVTDWVLVELRNQPLGSAVVEKSLFLKSDGTIVDLDGTTTTLTLTGVQAGNYYIVVKSRNHLTAISADPVYLDDSSVTSFDFTSGSGQFYNNTGIQLDGTETGAYAGDIDQDGFITSSDYVAFYNASLNGSPSYQDGDLNGDGTVNTTDFLLWQSNAKTAQSIEQD
jgi:hypothetical protein